MASEFDLNMIYTQIYTKEKLIELLEHLYDKEFIVSFLPRTKDNADILIRSLKKQIEQTEVKK